jgi:hypothetical protein
LVTVVLMVVAGARAFSAVTALGRTTQVTTSVTASSRGASVGLIYHSVLHLHVHAIGGSIDIGSS